VNQINWGLVAIGGLALIAVCAFVPATLALGSGKR